MKEEEKVAAAEASLPSARRGKLLIVDDEEHLVMATKRLLSRRHEVTALTSAKKAQDLIINGARFDLILCDVMMPGMTGADLHQELMREVPEQARKMVFMSGGAFTARVREFLDRVPNLCVEKPFEAAALRALIDGLLREP